MSKIILKDTMSTTVNTQNMFSIILWGKESDCFSLAWWIVSWLQQLFIIFRLVWICILATFWSRIIIYIIKFFYDITVLYSWRRLFQKFHWTWLCEQDDQALMKLFRSSNAASTMFIWISYIISPHYILNTPSIKMSIVQVNIAIETEDQMNI